MSGVISGSGFTPPTFSNPVGPLQTLSNLYAQEQSVPGGDQAVSVAIRQTATATLSGAGINAAQGQVADVFNRAFQQTAASYGPRAGHAVHGLAGTALGDTQAAFLDAQQLGSQGASAQALYAFRNNVVADSGLPAQDGSLSVLNGIANQVVSQFGTASTQGASIDVVG